MNNITIFCKKTDCKNEKEPEVLHYEESQRSTCRQPDENDEAPEKIVLKPHKAPGKLRGNRLLVYFHTKL